MTVNIDLANVAPRAATVVDALSGRIVVQLEDGSTAYFCSANRIRVVQDTVMAANHSAEPLFSGQIILHWFDQEDEAYYWQSLDTYRSENVNVNVFENTIGFVPKAIYLEGGEIKYVLSADRMKEMGELDLRQITAVAWASFFFKPQSKENLVFIWVCMGKPTAQLWKYWIESAQS